MGLKVDSIADLDPLLVEQLQSEFSELVAERHPEILLSTGVFHDLVSHFSGGVSGATNQTEVNRVLQSGSLLDIENNPELADDDLVDRVLSNYLITRKTGEAATGEISITVSEDITVVIQSGLIFTTSGQRFQVDNAFTARPVGSTTTAVNETVLTPLGDGTFSFSVPATAVEIGEAGNVRRGTQMTPDSPPQNYVNSVAATDFSGGTDTELNADLLTRLQEGIAAKVMQGRTNISALIKEQTAFVDTIAYSVIGYGNEEMLRDQHSIFPVSMGGRLDIYARTAPLPITVTLLKEATLVDITAAGGVWQFALNKTDAPGFYEVSQIIHTDDPVDTAGFEITSDLRGLDLPTTFAPDLVGTVESAYTKYQTTVIRFVDTVTTTDDLIVGTSKVNYSVAVVAMPLIDALQEFCIDSSVRNLASDVAVKAAVPCFLTLNFDIQIAAGTTAPDEAAILADLETTINKLEFPGQLNASLIHDIVHNYLADNQAVGKIDMHGRIRRPTGDIQLIRDTDVLRIPEDPGNLVTGHTVSFILDKDNVGISVVTEGFTLNV